MLLESQEHGIMRMTTNRYLGLICSAATGVALMWFLDPAAGGRRRAIVRDKSRWLSRRTRDASRALGHDLGNRVSGPTARALAGGAAVAGAAVALSMTVTRARRRRLESILPPPF
jgi:hypothetical protein